MLSDGQLRKQQRWIFSLSDAIIKLLRDPMELPITDKELGTIINALRLGGDTSLYQKLNTIHQIRKDNPGGPYKKIAREQFGYVI